MHPPSNSILAIDSKSIDKILSSKPDTILELVKNAYIAHEIGETILPFSGFLRPDANGPQRIISLPAHISKGKDFLQPITGIKWVSSFPENRKKGLPRASALIVLNDSQTGRAYSIMDATKINIYRTAASATLACKLLLKKPPKKIAIIGAGPINQQTMINLKRQFPSIQTMEIFDKIAGSTKKLIQSVQLKDCSVQEASSLQLAAKNADIVSIATSASSPHIFNPEIFEEGAIILHISLRDIAPEIIKQSFNIVDDRFHVNREHTSINLSSKKKDISDLPNSTIGEILLGKTKVSSKYKLNIVSPFGLGILDLALADYAYQNAIKQGLGTELVDFLDRS